MLSEIGVTNFKVFRDTAKIPLKPITLFTGVNGTGKSSVLQALLLMRQTIEHNENSRTIILNGDCVQLGSYEDVKNEETPESLPIKFDFTSFSNHQYRYFFSRSDQSSYELKLDSIEEGAIQKHLITDDIQLFHLMPKYIEGIDFLRTHYISASRIGPQPFFPKKSLGIFPNVGPKGENAANILELFGNEPVNEALYLQQDAQIVLDQTSLWLKEIFGKGSLELIGKQNDTPVLSLLINCSDSKARRFKQINSAFGFSYVLPIILSGLIAKPGDMLIVENPEAHLHPQAQSKITKFLTLVSQTGVQVLIESHSEHILNGIRISIARKKSKPEDISVVYFRQDANEPVMPIKVNMDGSIDNWPIGFFDQSEKDLQSLVGF